MTTRRPQLVAVGLVVAAAFVVGVALGTYFARPAEVRALHVGMSVDEAAAAIGRVYAYSGTDNDELVTVWRLHGRPDLFVFFAEGHVTRWGVGRDARPAFLERFALWLGV